MWRRGMGSCIRGGGDGLCFASCVAGSDGGVAGDGGWHQGCEVECWWWAGGEFGAVACRAPCSAGGGGEVFADAELECDGRGCVVPCDEDRENKDGNITFSASEPGPANWLSQARIQCGL